jgi:tetratricopeptide (TPR) repeat protein
MAKKTGKAAAGRKKSRPGAGSQSQPNLATLQALIALAARMADDPGESDLDRAQDKVFDAMRAPNRNKRIALAREALAISPLCAHAYSLLAQEARKPEEALSLYRQAVDAGKRALAESAFQEDVGHFWGLIETRPYMRALHGLARCLWDSGQRAAAVAHYQDMLRLNPNDNQGIRYSLIDAYLELGNEGGAASLLKRYKDDGAAAWAWSGALLAFRQTGDTAPSRKALAKAVKTNPHVPAYLLGRKALPRSLPDFTGMGDDSEAVSYVHDAAAAWAAAQGALAWIEAVMEGGAGMP